MKFILALALTTALASCGGGGSDGNTTTTGGAAATAFPVSAVVTQFLTVGASFTASATLGGSSLSVTQRFAPAANATFQGVTRNLATSTVVVTVNGTQAPASAQVIYFSQNPLTFYGTLNGSTTTTVTSTGTLPATAFPGDSGALWNGTTRNINGVVTGTQVATWSVVADTASTALLCLNTTTTPTGGTASNESDCYRVDANGATNGTGVFTGTVSGQAVTLR